MHSIIGRDPATQQGVKLLIEDGVVHDIREHEYSGTHWLSAGLIDLQVNGFAGYDLNDADVSVDRVLALANKLLTFGITTFLPTIITADQQQITHALQMVHQARQQYPLLEKMIPAVHLEGPYISPTDGPRGAHPLAHVRAPDKKEFTRWQQCCDSLIGLVTLSPHWPESAEFVDWLCAQGISVSIGHTDAEDQQIIAAVDAGVQLSTHLGNGIAAMLPRHPNLIWSQLAEDRLTAMFIADGHHLPASTLKSMLRAKGLAKSVLVSDVAAVGGLAPGVYKQPIGGNVVLSADGRLGIEGTSYLAGAARPLSDCIATVIPAAEISLSEALSLATCNAARFIGRSGTVSVGEPADIFTFEWAPGDSTLNVKSVMIRGEQVV